MEGRRRKEEEGENCPVKKGNILAHVRQKKKENWGTRNKVKKGYEEKEEWGRNKSKKYKEEKENKERERKREKIILNKRLERNGMMNIGIRKVKINKEREKKKTGK